MDLNGLLDQLKSSERQQLTPITQQKSSYQAKISAYGKLESALEKFQTAAAKLNDAKTFQPVSTKMTGDGPEVSADTTAVPGTYSIDVSNLAQAHSLASGGFTDITSNQASTATTITIDQPGVSGSSFDVSIDPASSSLGDIRDAINAADGGVTASVINDGTSNRLVLTAKETGAASAMTVTVNGDATLDSKLSFDPANTTTNGMTEQVAAQDASLTVNNIPITSASNQVEGAIQGVTLNLTQESANATTASTLSVTRDEGAIADSVQSFVDAYNSVQKTIGSLSSFNSENGDAGILLGDGTLRSVETQLRRTLSDGVSGGGYSMLSDVGVELQLDGTLKVDSDKLNGAISNDLQGVQRFFAGTDSADGLADTLDASISRMLDDKGVLNNATSGLKKSIDGLNEQYSRTEDRINSTIARYRKQFSQMDSLVSQMNSTMSYLSQQFSAMNAQLGK
ncbi:MAG: flagellar hook-associated protein 2 [Halomonadaceae bacterium T82-2]|nr:MAG: flagellar hook-associated protein 2 [Halomonadaceae bacterium T82-2]